MLSYLSQYGLLLFCYLVFFRSITIGHKTESRYLKDILTGKGDAGILFTQLIAGILFLGMGVAIIYVTKELDDSIFIPLWSEYHYSVWILVAVAMIIGVVFAKKIIPVPNSNSFLPPHLPLSFVLIRTLFLIVYELYFRGVMLFVMIEDFGILMAVVLNLFFYVFVHWFDKKERNGSVLMGTILCVVTIYYQNVWPAIIIHLSLALSHEIMLLINNKSLIKKSWL